MTKVIACPICNAVVSFNDGDITVDLMKKTVEVR